MPGRKLKLTTQLIKQCEDLIKAGNTLKASYCYLGIAERTFFRWLSEGEKADKGIKRQFWQKVRGAEAEAQIRNVVIIQEAAQEDWRAAAWFLERRFPHKWGRKASHKVTGMEDKPVEIEIARQMLIEKFMALGPGKTSD